MIEWEENETLLYLIEPIGSYITELHFYVMIMQ